MHRTDCRKYYAFHSITTIITDKGHFFEPTVLKIPGPENPAFQEEIFGPVVTVLPFKDEKHAVALANDSKYGLGGGVWTSNVARVS